MKRDMDLLREMLLAVENASPKLLSLPKFPTHEDWEVVEHANLAVQAGLLNAVVFTPLKGLPTVSNLTLTWEGHEFLDRTRDPDIWSQTKGAAKKVGSWSMPLLLELAGGFLKAKASSFGLPMA